MKISIVGAGYVGMVTGVCLADKGHLVTCIDIDQKRVDNINQGIPVIFESGLEDLLKKNIKTNLKATTCLKTAVLESDVTFIAVGTPFDGNKIDLSFIENASKQIGEALREKDTYHLVVVKSTVVPGTSDELVRPVLEKNSGKRPGVDFGVAMNPEFLREGEAINDFMYPDRIVLGGMDEKSVDLLAELYNVFEDIPVIKTNNKTAEMIKYTSNSLLATMISFSNEIGNLCASIGSVDVVNVLKSVHLDKRLSPMMPNGERIVPSFTTYLESGCGFGGSCFPKDVKALIAYGEKHDKPMRLLKAVISINRDQPGQMLTLLKKHFPSLKGLRVAILGLAFKPGTDDMRESPAIPIVNDLRANGVNMKAYDPVAKIEAQKIFDNPDMVYCDDLSQTIDDVQAILILTRWKEFMQLPELLKDMEEPPLVIDGRRMLDKSSIKRYDGIGL